MSSATQGAQLLLRDLRDALEVAWEVFKRRPFLFSLPVLAVVVIGYREYLDRWIDEAHAALGH